MADLVFSQSLLHWKGKDYFISNFPVSSVKTAVLFCFIYLFILVYNSPSYNSPSFQEVIIYSKFWPLSLTSQDDFWVCREHTMPLRLGQGTVDLHQEVLSVAFWPLLVCVVLCPLIILVTSAIEVFMWGKSDLVSRFGQGLGGFPLDLSV